MFTVFSVMNNKPSLNEIERGAKVTTTISFAISRFLCMQCNAIQSTDDANIMTTMTTLTKQLTREATRCLVI